MQNEENDEGEQNVDLLAEHDQYDEPVQKVSQGQNKSVVELDINLVQKQQFKQKRSDELDLNIFSVLKQHQNLHYVK